MCVISFITSDTSWFDDFLWFVPIDSVLVQCVVLLSSFALVFSSALSWSELHCSTEHCFVCNCVLQLKARTVMRARSLRFRFLPQNQFCKVWQAVGFLIFLCQCCTFCIKCFRICYVILGAF